MKDRLGWAATVGAGLVLWTVASMRSSPTEAWDTEEFWTLYIPIAYALCGVFGFLFPTRTWRWALAVMLPLLLVMPFITGRVGPLFVAGLSFQLLYSAPGIVTAMLGAFIRRWISQDKSS